MPANSLSTQILALSLTKSEAISFANLLRRYLELKLFGGEARDFLEQLDNSQSEKVKSLNLAGVNQKNLAETFKNLEADIRQIATLTLILPYSPTLYQRRELKNFLQKKLTSDFLLDLKLDPSLLAGARLIRQGVSRDFSVKQKIQDRSKELEELFTNL